jgi:hypothetical protein
MHWIRKFDEPIALKDGRKIATLADARRLMLSLPEIRLRSRHWQDAGELLLKAANSQGSFALARARAQLPRALQFEGLIETPPLGPSK